MSGGQLAEGGLEITEEYEEFQLCFEPLKMKNVAAQAGQGFLLEWGGFCCSAHGRRM